MFRMDQIVTATQFLRHFRALADYLAKADEPLLITQKGGRFLVVMDGEFFDGLARALGGPTQRARQQAHRHAAASAR
jgi:hypothetical protein